MAYQKITLTQDGQYIAIRTELRFAINFTNNSVFGGAKVKTYKAFTKINGDIGFEHKVNKSDGTGEQIVYDKPQDTTYQAGLSSNWIIFELSDATATTNIEVTINHDYPNITTNEVASRNIKTNITLIEQI